VCSSAIFSDPEKRGSVTPEHRFSFAGKLFPVFSSDSSRGAAIVPVSMSPTSNSVPKSVAVVPAEGQHTRTAGFVGILEEYREKFTDEGEKGFGNTLREGSEKIVEDTPTKEKGVR